MSNNLVQLVYTVLIYKELHWCFTNIQTKLVKPFNSLDNVFNNDDKLHSLVEMASFAYFPLPWKVSCMSFNCLLVTWV